MNNPSSYLHPALISISISLAPLVGAAITIDKSTDFKTVKTFNAGTFDASKSDKLVVVASGEHGYNGSAKGQIKSISYDGAVLTKAVDVDPDNNGHGDTATDIWYLDNPGMMHTSGVLSATVASSGENYVFTVMGLSGTLPGVGATAAAPGTAALELTTVGQNSLVIFNLGTGGGGNTADDGIDPNSPSGAEKIAGLVAGSNWAGHNVSRATLRAPASMNYSFDTAKKDVAIIAAEFLAKNIITINNYDEIGHGFTLTDESLKQDPFLMRLQKGFLARLQTDAMEPYQTALEKLNQSYIANGIPPARAAAQQKGDLNEILELDKEKKRIEAGEGVPHENHEHTPESLRQLRALYRETHEQLLEERENKTAPLYDIYIEALDTHIAKVTRNGRIPHAKKVKALRDTIAGRKSFIVDAETEVLVAVSSEPGVPTAPPAALDTADSIDASAGASPEELVRWALSVGAEIQVRADGETIEVRDEKDIPRGRFDVIAFGLRDNKKSKSVTEADFNRLAGHEELVRISLNEVKVGDAAFAFCGSTPKLHTLHLSNVPVTDEIIAHLAHLTAIRDLRIQGTRDFTGNHLVHLPTLPQLTSLDFQHSGITEAGLLHLAEARKLEWLNLGNTSVTDAGVASLGSLSALKVLKLDGCKKLKGSFLTLLPKLPELRALDIGRCPIEKQYFSGLSRHTQLEDLGVIDNPNFDDDALSQLAPLVRLKSLSLTGTKISGSGFHSLKDCTAMRELMLGNTLISSKGISTIAATFPKLDHLDFAYTLKVNPEDLRPLASMDRLARLTMSATPTDAALVEIAEIPGLSILSIQNSEITAEGLTSLKRAKELKELYIHGCKRIDDSAIPALKRLRNLETVHLGGTSISKEAMTKLKKSRSINWNIK